MNSLIKELVDIAEMYQNDTPWWGTRKCNNGFSFRNYTTSKDDMKMKDIVYGRSKHKDARAERFKHRVNKRKNKKRWQRKRNTKK